MGNYAIFLEGNNFRLGDIDGEPLSGFFVTKRVEASNAEEAQQLAIQTLWRHPDLVGQESNIPKPSIEVRVVHKLLDSNKMKDIDLVVFPMDEQ